MVERGEDAHFHRGGDQLVGLEEGIDRREEVERPYDEQHHREGEAAALTHFVEAWLQFALSKAAVVEGGSDEAEAGIDVLQLDVRDQVERGALDSPVHCHTDLPEEGDHHVELMPRGRGRGGEGSGGVGARCVVARWCGLEEGGRKAMIMLS